MKTRKSARNAYLEAEVVTGLAHQIRAIRNQRGWTQSDLAKKLGTSQTVVSRLEDPSYGRYSLQTLLELAKIFDSGMQVKFVSFVTMLHQTFRPDAAARKVPSFDDEAGHVSFYDSQSRSAMTKINVPVSKVATKTIPNLVIAFDAKPLRSLQIDIYQANKEALSS